MNSDELIDRLIDNRNKWHLVFAIVAWIAATANLIWPIDGLATWAIVTALVALQSAISWAFSAPNVRR